MTILREAHAAVEDARARDSTALDQRVLDNLRGPAATGTSRPCTTDRDTTMNEDAQRLRAGSSAQVIAAVRNTAVAALRLAGLPAPRPAGAGQRETPPGPSPS